MCRVLSNSSLFYRCQVIALLNSCQNKFGLVYQFTWRKKSVGNAQCQEVYFSRSKTRWWQVDIFSKNQTGVNILVGRGSNPVHWSWLVEKQRHLWTEDFHFCFLDIIKNVPWRFDHNVSVSCSKTGWRQVNIFRKNWTVVIIWIGWGSNPVHWSCFIGE